MSSVFNSYFRSYDGTKIYYEVRGEGEPIVLIYGIACLINHWHFQIEELSKKHKVICYDLRGHHKSDVPMNVGSLSLESLGKDLSHLLRELNIKKAHIVGHSFGAQVILKAYELYPQIFKSLIFVNGFAKNPIKGMFGLDIFEKLFYWIKSNYDSNPILFDSIWQASINNPISMIASGLMGGFNLELTQFKDIEIYAKGVSQVPLRVFLSYFEDMISFDGLDVAKKITAPTLILSGDKDSITPMKFQHELHHAVVGSEFVTIPYGSHCSQLDFPDYISLKISDFVERTARELK